MRHLKRQPGGPAGLLARKTRQPGGPVRSCLPYTNSINLFAIKGHRPLTYHTNSTNIHVTTKGKHALSSCVLSCYCFITFCVSHRRRKMYCGDARLCVCVSAAVRAHYCMDPDVTWGSGRGCPLVVHYWADLQSVHGLHCYGNIM